MIRIEPFTEEHLEAAGRLFAEKYRALPDENRLLPEEFRGETAVRPQLAQTINEHPGAVALSGDRLVGYLTGFGQIPAFKGNAPGVYIPVWGHGAAAGQDRATIYAALYTEMAAAWLARRSSTHLLSYFAPDDELEALLFGLGFGLLVIDGLRPLSPPAAQRTPNVEIREASEQDLAGLARLNRGLRRHLRGTPTFLHVAVEKETLSEIGAAFIGERMKTFVAARDGAVISCMRGRLDYGPGCKLFDAAGSLGIDFAYTDTAVREKGVATALLQAVLRWGREEGMTRCVVDFEAANLVAKRFWLRHFRPICRSAVRRVDERVSTLTAENAESAEK